MQTKVPASNSEMLGLKADNGSTRPVDFALRSIRCQVCVEVMRMARACEGLLAAGPAIFTCAACFWCMRAAYDFARPLVEFTRWLVRSH
eukprot:5610085-Amphidinium_carterae.1